MEALRSKSTSMKLLCNEQCLNVRENEHIMNNRVFKNRVYAPQNSFVPFGINNGQRPNDTLAYNPIEVESKLFGMDNNRVFNPRMYDAPVIHAQQKSMKEQYFYHRPNAFLPEPLVIENNQRPIIP
jgi:hypothetical protein